MTVWLAHVPNQHARMHILCFPYSGAPAGLFDQWRIPGIDMLPVILPGRGPRHSEPLPATMEELVNGIVNDVIPLLPGPYALLGHSMGAWVAHAVATRLTSAGHHPERLFVISAPPPPVGHMPVRQFSSLHTLNDEAMADEVIRLGGAPPSARDHVLGNVDVIRADATIVGTYRPTCLPVTCPVTVVTGSREPLFYPSDIHRWNETTTASLTAQVINGGHFLVHDQTDELLRIVERDSNAYRADPVAVIGMAFRLPGASSPSEFWSLLRTGRNAVGPVPSNRVTNPDCHVMHCGGFIDNIELFDAQHFGFTPREAHRSDPRLRLLLMTVQEALDDAGMTPADVAGPRTGIWCGESHNDYWDLSLPVLPPNMYSLTAGGLKSFLAGRVSHAFNLQGPSITLDTSCSSSLTAVHAACQALHTREVDVALAAGAHLVLNPDGGPSLGLAKALSPNGRSAFASEDADGYARGEGIATVVLKRLPDAVLANDPIHAVITGTAINANGRTSRNIVTTSVPGQVRMIRQALANAAVSPAEIGYVEAHGPGTRVGDDVELAALDAVYGDNPNPCLIGSAKTNIGHLEPVAGIAGMIKTVLTVSHGMIPASLHHKEPTTAINWDASALRVPTTTQPWRHPGDVRRAAVSSFGLSGANAHAIISQAPHQHHPRPRRARRTWNLHHYWYTETTGDHVH